MKYRIALSLVLLIGGIGFTQEKSAASSTPVTFGSAHIAVPAGWTHVERPGGMVMIPPDITGQKTLTIVVLPGRELPRMDFAQAVDAVLKKSLAANERLLQYSELPLRKAPGYDFLTRAMVIGDEAGQSSVRVCFAANPGGRLEMLMVSADSNETLKQYEAEIGLVLNSYSFADTAAQSESKKEERGAKQASTTERPERDTNKAGSARTTPAGPRTLVAEGESVLLCTEPSRLDFAMDAAKNGDNYAASRALRYDYFFRVTGPAWVVITESDTKSRWPKAFVTVVDGDSAGRTGWVLLSELKRAEHEGK